VLRYIRHTDAVTDKSWRLRRTKRHTRLAKINHHTKTCGQVSAPLIRFWFTSPQIRINPPPLSLTITIPEKSPLQDLIFLELSGDKGDHFNLKIDAQVLGFVLIT